MTTIPAIPTTRTHLTMPELMTHWGWNENDLREAIMLGRLVPSYFISRPLWPVPAPQPKSPAVSKSAWMYLLAFKQVGAVDGYFHRLADTHDALTTGNTVFKLDGSGYTKDHLIRLADVMSDGVVMMDEVTRYETSIKPVSSPQPTDPKVLGTRERDTLLTIIAILCKVAKYDYTMASKTAKLIQSEAAFMKIPIGETTIEGHLKKIPDALGSRTE